MNSGSRMLFLDVLRAAACLLVIGTHTEFPSQYRFLTSVSQGGWIGVDLFFVLSGFLVSGLLFREYKTHCSVNIGRFLIRRGLKIYPAFFAFLLTTVTAIHSLAKDPSLASGWPLAAEVLFLQNYWPSLWGHTWSLAVEEHFYIGIAVLVGVLLTCRIRLDSVAIPVIMIAISIVALVLRLRLAETPFSFKTHVSPSHLRMDSLAFGVLLAFFWTFHQDALRSIAKPFRWGLIFAGLAALIPVFLWPRESTPWMNTFGLTQFYAGCGAILVGMAYLNFPVNRLTTFIAALGAQSYSIYLWHAPVVNWIAPQVKKFGLESIHPLLRPSVTVVLCLFVGVFMARLIEIPVLKLREVWFPARSTPSVPVTTPVSVPA